MIPQPPHRLRRCCAVGRHGAPVAQGAEQFRRVETEAAGESPRTTLAAVVRRAQRLGRVLDDDQLVFGRDGHQRLHVAQAAVQVHRNHRPGAGGYRGFHQAHVHVVVGSDIDEHRSGARVVDRGSRRHKRVGDGNDFISRADAGRPHHQVQCVGAVAGPYAVLRADELGEMVLKIAELLAQHEIAALEHGSHRPHELGFHAAKLGRVVYEPDAPFHPLISRARAASSERTASATALSDSPKASRR